MEVGVSRSTFDRSTSERLPAVEVDDVFKIYRQGNEETVALRGASLSVGAGEFVALLGRSGSGKSTLLHLISGLDVPSAGRVVINGRDVGQLDEEERARIRQTSVGIVLQRDNLIPYLSAVENVALAPRLAGKADAQRGAKELLRQVRLSEKADQRVTTLSGGEQQRVAIAVALAFQPQVLIGDELTGELDSHTASAVLDLLVSQQQKVGMALLLVTHDPEVAARAHRIIRMQNGVVVTE